MPTTWTGGPRPASARVYLLPTGLEIVTEGGARLSWPYAEVRQTQGAYAGEPVRLERGGELPEALLVPDVGFLTALHRVTPVAARRFHDPASAAASRPSRRRRRPGGGRHRGLCTCGSSRSSRRSSRPGCRWRGRSGWAARSRHRRRPTRCTDRGRATARRDRRPAGRGHPRLPYTIRAFVVDRKQVNAFAAPGGYVVLFRGLIERAGNPEEVAGVLAHEIQHVAQRHATRALVRQASTGLLLAAMTGDASGVFVYGVEAARTLGTLRYSRQAEEEADLEGLRLLVAAGIEPAGMVTFFESLRRKEGDLAKRATSRPIPRRPSGSRDCGRPYQPRPGLQPALPEEWAQLRRSARRAGRPSGRAQKDPEHEGFAGRAAGGVPEAGDQLAVEIDDLPGDARPAEALGALGRLGAEPPAALAVGKQPGDGGRQRRGVALGHQQARHVVLDGHLEPAYPRADDRHLHAIASSAHHAERLVERGHDAEVGGGVVVGQRLAAAVPEVDPARDPRAAASSRNPTRSPSQRSSLSPRPRPAGRRTPEPVGLGRRQRGGASPALDRGQPAHEEQDVLRLEAEARRAARGSAGWKRSRSTPQGMTRTRSTSAP